MIFSRLAPKAISTSSLLCNPSRLSEPHASALPPSSILLFVRHATHKSEGRANGPKDGPGKRLGAKKGSEEYVIPGNIIFRQRGTEWFPGENCGMGRDHCIFAKESGYVKFYRDPQKHPKRRYIGVTFNRDDVLPYSPFAARRRRLGMVAVSPNEQIVDALSGEETRVLVAAQSIKSSRSAMSNLSEDSSSFRRRGHAIREANWEIGRAAERAGVTVKKSDPKDRFAVWRRKSEMKVERAKGRAIASKKAKVKGKGKRTVQ